METFKKNKLIWLIILCVSVLPVRAGVLSELSGLVEPGGVEIPAIVNVFGPEEPNDVNNVKEIFRTANDILKQANVQFGVKWILTGITEIGDGDGRLTENEFSEVLLGSVFELEKPFGPGRGIKINIADDVWVERPELVFWHDIFYPVTFLESSLSPEQLGRILAREVGVTAGLSPSSDMGNLMYPDGTGTSLDENQSVAIRELAREVGLVRSPLAVGYAPEVLQGLRYKGPGALFYSDGFTLRGDYRSDVYSEDAGGSQIGDGGVDLEAFIAKSGRIGASNADRSLILKYYFGIDELPEETYIDTYLRVYDYKNHSDNGNGFSNGDPYESFDAVIGIGLTSSTPPYVGVINLLAGQDFHVLAGIEPVVEHDRERIKAKVEIPFSRLTTHLPESVLNSLNDGRGLELQVTANSFSFDVVEGLAYQQDDINNIKFASIPKLLPQITAEYRYDGIDPTTLSLGFDARTTILQDDSNSLDKNAIRELLCQPISGVESGRVVLPWINFNTNANNDSFNSANGFPNNPYPGIDLSGGTDLLFITEARAMIELAAGLYIFGLQGTDSAIMQINPIQIGSLIHYNPGMRDDIDHGSNSGSFNGLPPYKGSLDDNHLGVLQRGDTAIEVKDPGLYLFTVRSLSQISAVSNEDVNGTSGASLEVQQVLLDGSRVLLGGVLPAYVPPAEIDVPNLPEMPDVPNGTDGLFDGFETGDFSGLPWTFGGDADWIIGTSERHSGTYSARAGFITDEETTIIEVTLQTGQGEISFWRNVSSENGFDFLRFSIDSELKGEWSGDSDWEQISFPIESGQHSFKWSYEKDSSVSSGEDTAWFDDVVFP